MSPGRLRRQADACLRLADLMSDPRDRDRLLRTEKTFRVLADEEEVRSHLDVRSASVNSQSGSRRS